MSVLDFSGLSHFKDKIDELLSKKASNEHKHLKSDITDFPLLGTASTKDIASSGNASTSQVVMGNDTRLTDARKASDVSDWAKASTKPTYTANEIGLGNVGNFKAVSTVASQGLTDTEKANARANIGAQVDGSYASSTHNHDDKYQTKGSYASASHAHDDRYYTETEIDTKLNGKANSSHTHDNGEITSLDASKITSGTISIDRLPQGALERLTVVADDTARFKLTSSTVQKGDTVKVTSTGKMYYVVDETKLSSEAGYEVYAAGTAASVPWSGVTDKPSTYTPSSHTHTKSQITDFPTIPTVNNPTITITQAGSTKGTFTLNQSGNTTIALTDNNTTYSAVTTSANGLMSSTDKSKLDGIASGATAVTDSIVSGWGYKKTDTNTWIAFKGATTSAAGTAGYAPAPSAGAANRYLRSDGTWTVPPDTNTTYTLAGLMGSSAKGSATQPVYWNGSAWTNTTYTLGKSVPSNAVFTDTTYSTATTSANGLMSSTDKSKLDGIASGATAYTHPTTSGNKHIPSGGSSGQILRWSADGTAVWGAETVNGITYSTAKPTTVTAGMTWIS